MPSSSETSLVDIGEVRRHRLDLLRSVCTESFADFARHAWPVMEPTRAWLPSHAANGVCAALQAVADGRIKRLAISLPPGVGKSLFGAVAFPAWLLLRTLGSARIMVGSYSWSFATRDSGRCRDLVVSDWYQGLVDGAWAVREDANHKDDWWTNVTGRRLISSVGGKSTGERCTWQIMDDALSAADVLSNPAKAEAIRWVMEVLPSRLEDQRVDPRVLIGQRLDVDDPIAAALKRHWKYLCLPAVLGPDDAPCVLYDDNGVEVWRDTRAVGEPLIEILDVPSLDRLRVDLGSTTFNTQYLQKPSDDSAAVFRRTWWRFYRPAANVPADSPRPAGCDTAMPAVEMPPHFDRIVITADLTFGSVDGDYAVAQAWGSVGPDRYLLAQWRQRAGFEVSLLALVALARRYPMAKVCIEKAAHGVAVLEQIRQVIPGVVAIPPKGKKEQRHAAAAPTCESGNCFLPLGVAWLGDFVEEHAGATKHDDQLDTTSYAIAELNHKSKVPPSVGGLAVTGDDAATSSPGDSLSGFGFG